MEIEFLYAAENKDMVEQSGKALANERRLCLKSWQVKFLYVFYTLLAIVSAVTIVFSIINYQKNAMFSMVIVIYTSIACALFGSCSYYIRKLYKDGLTNKVQVHDADFGACKFCIHTFMYFVFRPIFATISSIIVVLGVKQGYYFLSTNSPINEENFFYFLIIVSFLVGFNISKMFRVFNKDRLGGLFDG